MGIPSAHSKLTAVLITGAFALAMSACSDSTGPSDDERPVIEASETQLAQSQEVADDISVRLLPSVTNFPGTLELAAAASALGQAVAERDAQGVLDQIARARTALAQIRQNSTQAHAADLDAIELALSDTQLLVTFPSSS